MARLIRTATAFILSLVLALPAAAADWPAILESAFQGRLDKVRNLLDSGVDVDARDREGSTPLMVAASKGHLAVVSELLSRGANVNAQNNYGWTPVMLATVGRHESVIKLLLAEGANPLTKNRNGDNAISLAKSSRLEHLFSTPSVKPEPPPTRPTRPEQEINRFLAQADRQLRAQRLTEPAGDNAYESYSEVLKRDATNAQAQAGLQEIANRYERLAQRDLRAGDLQQSLVYIEKGLQVWPRDPSLQRLQQQVQQQLSRPEPQESEVDRLLAQAERQLRTLHLTTPENDNALDTYRQVLKLDPNNAQARTGLQRIAEQYEEWARRYQLQGRLEDSIDSIDKGLQAQPENTGLRSLKEEVAAALIEQENQKRLQAEVERQRIEQERLLAEQERQQAAQQRRLQQIDALLTQAEQQLQANRLASPPGDNAYETYQQTLALDPDNAKAKTGLERIVAQYQDLARIQLDQGALQDSLDSIQQGLQVQPEHPQLLALRQTVQDRIAEQERLLAEQERQQAAQQRRLQQIDALLTQAEQQLQANRLASPPGDNAYETYQQTLALDPDNAKAKTGMQKLLLQAKQIQKEKMNALQQIEQELNVEEQALRLSIQKVLTQEWKRRNNTP